jgi:hypothetical protein
VKGGAKHLRLLLLWLLLRLLLSYDVLLLLS